MSLKGEEKWTKPAFRAIGGRGVLAFVVFIIGQFGPNTHRKEVRNMKAIKLEIETVESVQPGTITLEIEALEERIAPSQPPGLLGYEGQPGNQGGPQHHP